MVIDCFAFCLAMHSAVIVKYSGVNGGLNHALEWVRGRLETVIIVGNVNVSLYGLPPRRAFVITVIRYLWSPLIINTEHELHKSNEFLFVLFVLFVFVKKK